VSPEVAEALLRGLISLLCGAAVGVVIGRVLSIRKYGPLYAKRGAYDRRYNYGYSTHLTGWRKRKYDLGYKDESIKPLDDQPWLLRWEPLGSQMRAHFALGRDYPEQATWDPRPEFEQDQAEYAKPKLPRP
jgi:hypothetical protein